MWLKQILQFVLTPRKPAGSPSSQPESPPLQPSPAEAHPPPARVSPPIDQCRKWRLTQYYLASQDDHAGPKTVPILDKYGKLIERASVAYFASLSLEGSGITAEGKLVNVAGSWVKCKHEDYVGVMEFHKKYLSKRPFSYSGLQVVNDRVVKVLAFYEVPQSRFGKGFGVCNGIPLDPYRTLAADIGRGRKSDPKFKGKGGVVPVGTDVYVHEFAGMKLPDGSIHDGWCKVNDTGGGIFGAHFDVFIGYDDNKKLIKVPLYGRIWFEGIDKLPNPYTYGLHDDANS